MAHVVGVLPDEVAQPPLGEEAVGVVGVCALAQVENHVGAVVVGSGALALGRGLDGVALDAVGLPGEGLVGAEGATHDTDLVRHHERGVEPDAELADNVHVIALVLGVLLLELLRAGVRDGAEVLVELLLGHADAVVRDGNRARVLVEGQADRERGLVDLDVGVGEALEAQLVDGVRRVRDELPQEDLLVGVDRVDHEVEQLLALGLELLHQAALPFCTT